MEPLGFLLWVPVALVALWILRAFAVFQLLLRAELRRTPHARLDPHTLSPAELEFLHAKTWELEAYGFTVEGLVSFASIDAPPDAPRRAGLCLRHGELGTWALVTENENGDPSEPHAVSFWTTFEDGTVLGGMNAFAHLVLVVPPRWEVADAYATTLEGQWTHYKTQLDRRRAALLSDATRRPEDALRAVTPRVLDLEAFIASSDERTAEVLEAGERAGLLVRTTRGTSLIRPMAAATFARRLLQGAERVRQTALQRQKERESRARLGLKVPSIPNIPVEIEANAYRRFEAQMGHRAHRPAWRYLLIITGLVFSASLLGVLTPRSVAILALVVLLHELGHYAAMRAFGFSDATLFFIPFFGGAATGTKARVTLAEEVIVLLAGPVPGIGLALLIRALPPDPWGLGSELTLTLLLVNGVNLLPIFPLDGGKIVDALLFLERPAFAMLFRLGAAGAFLAFSVLHEDPIMFALGLLVLVLIPSSLKIARLARVLERTRAPATAEPRVANPRASVEDVIHEMRGLGLGATPRASRFAMMRQVVQRMDRTPARVTTTLGWLTAHGASLGVAVFAFFTSGSGRPARLEPTLPCEEAASAQLLEALELQESEPTRTRQATFAFAFDSEAAAREVHARLGGHGPDGESPGREVLPAILTRWSTWHFQDTVFLEADLQSARQPAAILGYFREAGCVAFDYRVESRPEAAARPDDETFREARDH